MTALNALFFVEGVSTAVQKNAQKVHGKVPQKFFHLTNIKMSMITQLFCLI